MAWLGRANWSLLLTAGAVVAIGTWLFVAYRPSSMSEVGILLATLFAALSAFGSLLAVREMAADRSERNQPSVLADMEISYDQVIHFVVKNIGAGSARSVAVKFDPEPIDYTGKNFAQLPIFQASIPILQPGGTLRQFFNTVPNLFSQDVPKAFQIIVEYQDEGGRKYTRTVFQDLGRYEGTSVPAKTVEEHLEDIAERLKRMQNDLHGVIQSGSFMVATREQHNARMRAMVEEMKSRSKDTSGPPDP